MEISPENKGLDLIGALGRFSVVSLSHPVSPKMPHWPGDPRTEFEVWSERSKDGYFLRRFSMGEHSGTHLTAPASYFADGRTVDLYTPGELVRPVVVMDVREQCGRDPNYALPLREVLAWEEIHGGIQPGHVILLNTGWSERWHDAEAYLGRTPAAACTFRALATKQPPIWSTNETQAVSAPTRRASNRERTAG